MDLFLIQILSQMLDRIVDYIKAILDIDFLWVAFFENTLDMLLIDLVKHF